MTAQILGRSPNQAVIGSEVDKSFPNADGTYQTAEGSKIAQGSDKVLVTVAGRDGLAPGMPFKIAIESCFTLGEELSPEETLKQLMTSEGYSAMCAQAGVSNDALTQSAVCGLLSTLNEASDNVILAPLDRANGKKVTSREFGEILLKIRDFVSKTPTDKTLKAPSATEMSKAFSKLNSPKLIDHLGEDLGVVIESTAEQEAELCELIANALHLDYPERNDTLLCAVGYGRNQVVPAIATAKVVACVVTENGPEMIYSLESDDPAVNGIPTRVTFPAQDSILQAEVHGVSREFAQEVVEVAVEGAEQVFSAKGKDLENYRSGLANIVNDWMEERTANFLRVFGAMGETAAAQTAELMVRMQELTAAMGDTQATCGGPVEVATITKCNGIRWHRRYDS